MINMLFIICSHLLVILELVKSKGKGIAALFIPQVQRDGDEK